MEKKQIFYDILNEVTKDVGTPEEIKSWIQKHTDRRYPLNQIKDELLMMYASGLVETDTGFQATKSAYKLWKKLQKKEQKTK